jgi:hypothetical protein
MEVKKEIVDRINQLEEKYSQMGQSIESYLDGISTHKVNTETGEISDN